MPSPSGDAPGTTLTPGMRVLLGIAGALVLLAGIQLFVFTERTDEYFAWTIDPPLGAAFLGAAYWSSVVLEWTAARARRWVDARIAVPSVFVFTALTFVVTLVHLENFHLGVEHGTATRAVTWLWIAIYAVVPVLMVVVWIGQARRRVPDPPRTSPLPPWLAALVGVQGAVMVVVGLALLVDPDRVSSVWPWTLTPLVGRAIGAWLVSLGFAAAHALWERDTRRLRPAAAAYVAFGVLQTIALARYPDTVAWGDPETIAYVAVIASTLVAGVATLAVDRSRHPPAGAAPADPRRLSRIGAARATPGRPDRPSSGR